MSYDNNHIAAIILKNEFGACSPEEMQALDLWYKTLDDNKQSDSITDESREKTKQDTWASISAKIENEDNEAAKIIEFKPAKSFFFYMVRIAAMIILITGTYAAFNYFSSSKNIDGISYITKINKGSSPVKIILPDNSFIWLDAKSSVKYPKQFTNTRTISMVSGKIFLNVAHDTSRPFIVEIDNGLKTIVLGTSFIIEKGNTNNSVKVSVLKGKVQVSDNEKKYATLTKNQSVNVIKTVKSATRSVADSVEMTKWFNKILVLDNVELKDVGASIKENFGYTVEFSSPQLSSQPCSITYNQTDNVEDILLLLDKIYHTTHIITGKSILIETTKK